MKMMIFGIDGLGFEGLKHLGLKKLEQRLNNGITENSYVKNVISRGWCDMYTGKDAFETGAFLQVPTITNEPKPTQNTGYSAIKKIESNEFLWEKVNSLGLSMGIFGVPTISKPIELNGFSVAATGAGKFGNDVTEDDLYPKNLFKNLNIKDIDLGFRMGYGAFMPQTIEELELNANKHLADYFFTLNRVLDKNPVDVCFAASRFITEMGYKFLGLCASDPQNDFEKKLKNTVLELCSSFDAQLDDFLNKVNPEHLFIVSDHGLKPYEYDLNLNQFLVNNGFLSEETGLVRFAKNCVKDYLTATNPRKYSPRVPRYDRSSGEYFSIGYMNALYLNDQRFGGNQYSQEQAYTKSTTFAERLNELAVEQELAPYIKFHAVDKPSIIGDGQNAIAVPNIVCDMVDGLNNSERKFEVLKPKEYAFEKMFTHGFYGEHSACKASDTLAGYCGPDAEKVTLSKLTTIYGSILDVLKKN